MNSFHVLVENKRNPRLVGIKFTQCPGSFKAFNSSRRFIGYKNMIS